MKVILTETQFKLFLCEERLTQVLQESLNEAKSFNDIMAKIKQALVAGVAISVMIPMVHRLNIPENQKNMLINYIEQQDEAKKEEPGASVDPEHEKRVKACEDYMNFALKNQGFSLDSTRLKPETLVSIADKNDFDLPFLMAAAHLESCFGATNRAKKTNSVFSVGAYDDGRDVVAYADPNDSVEGYINLLNNHYLINGKTIQDLMKPGQFVNELGKRYASNKNYENKIKYLRNLILTKHPELA